jgi:hypothetical protein
MAEDVCGVVYDGGGVYGRSVLYVKWKFRSQESINTSHQFLGFIGVNVPY